MHLNRAKLDKSYFMNEYMRINQDWYDDFPESILYSSSVEKLEDGLETVDFSKFRENGYQLVNLPAETPAEGLLSQLEAIFGPSLHDGGAKKSVQTLIKAEVDGVYFANTNYTQPLHMDDAHTTRPPRMITLYCVEQAAQGGISTLLSVDKLYTEVIEAEETSEINLYDPNLLSIDGMHGSLQKPLLVKLIEGRIGMNFPAILNSLAAYEPVVSLYKRIVSYLHTPSNQLRFKLRPGQLLLIDNFRVFHGRTKFAMDDARLIVRTCFADSFFRDGR